MGDWGQGLEAEVGEDGVELGVEVVDGAVVEDVIVGDGDGAAFFDMFDFAVVAGADFGGSEGALGAATEAVDAEGAGSDDGDDGKAAGEFVFEEFVFGPGIETVEDDGLLAGGDEISGFGDGLAADPVVAFGGTDFLAELALGFGGDFDAAFLHFFVEETAEVDFGEAAFGEIVNDDGFAAAGHADDGKKFDILGGVTHE